MKKILSFMSFLFATFSLSNAQTWTPFLKTDTVTAGEFDDAHPVVYHSSFNSGMENNPWVVFERRSNTESMITAKRFITNSTAWDTSVTIISSSSIIEEQRMPDLAMIEYSSTGKILRRTLAAWQEKADSVWNIYYSTITDDSVTWSNPLPLTSGTSSNTNVRVWPFHDSTFIVSWKNNNFVLYSLLSPSSITPSETLAVSNFDSLEYDLVFTYSTGAIIWTERDTAGQIIFAQRYINTYPSFSLTEPETLTARGDISNPRFASYASPSYGPVLYESSFNGKHSIYLANGQDTTNFLNDPNTDYRNARTYTLPFITKPLAKSDSYAFDLFVVERIFANDSSLLFERSTTLHDTLRSTGHNRDACIGSSFIYFPQYASYGVQIVWESNRSGRTHIYSRSILMPLGDVRDESGVTKNFELSQNFPNPFNPSTVIRFQLPTAATVSLKIFDVLGREIQTLIEQKLTTGNYSAKWDGSHFASGVYFCRLQAGDFVQTKKLLLLK